MQGLNEIEISCPYCGERSIVLVDGSVDEQCYIEDCQVCCRPIVFTTRANRGEQPQLEVRREDDG